MPLLDATHDAFAGVKDKNTHKKEIECD